MSKLKNATKDFLVAGKNLTTTLFDESKEVVKPLVNKIQQKVEFEKTKQKIKQNKVVDVKRDTSRRKYH